MTIFHRAIGSGVLCGSASFLGFRLNQKKLRPSTEIEDTIALGVGCLGIILGVIGLSAACRNPERNGPFY